MANSGGNGTINLEASRTPVVTNTGVILEQLVYCFPKTPSCLVCKVLAHVFVCRGRFGDRRCVKDSKALDLGASCYSSKSLNQTRYVPWKATRYKYILNILEKV